MEAVRILGSLLCYPNAFPNMKIYQIGSPLLGEQSTVTSCRDIKVTLNVVELCFYECIIEESQILLILGQG